MRIETDFAGGNVIVESMDGDVARVRQDRRTTTTWWFYWCFRVRDVAGKTVEFQFTDGDAFGACGPCFSADGEAWRWLGREVVRDNAFRHTFAAEQDEGYFAFCIPYVEKHLREFLSDKSQGQRDVLTNSEKGRAVELLTLASRRPKYFVPIVARSHACETMGSYVLEGMMEFWLQSPPDSFLRENVTLQIVPFLDKDGVEAGDQGKNRAPHDHNRDYLPEPLYASTRALMRKLGEWGDAMPIAFDLHCPYIKGGRNDKIFFIGQPQPQQARLDRFLSILTHTQRGELQFDGEQIPFGTEWNIGENGMFTRHIGEQFPDALPCGVEFPYALASGQVVTAENARAFGHDLARAMTIYLMEL